MTTILGSRIQSTLLIGSVMMISACAATKSGDAIKTGETIVGKTEETTLATSGKVALDAPIDKQPAGAKKVLEPGNTGSRTTPETPETTQAPKAAVTRIKPKEPYVNIRSEPSAKSRSIAVLKGGHSIEVLETKDSWVKITWQKGNAMKQGWMKKSFAEGHE